MIEIELSMMPNGPNPLGDLQPVLNRFEAQHHIRVRVNLLSWETAWADLVKVALYKHGPDVSQIGSTWVGSLIGMNALRPFTRSEINSMGGAPAFLEAAWRSVSLLGETQVWAIPWLADTRLIYYWRDVLAKAGIDTSTAFTTPRAFAQTIQRLHDQGVDTPWVVPTHYTLNTLHNVACWVWGTGGDFITGDGRRTLFSQPPARAGVRAYFDLQRHLSPAARQLGASASDALFQQGRAAITIAGPWLILMIGLDRAATPEVIRNLGVARAPGVPFVGGSNLVVWQHTRHERAAIELVRFLTSPEAQAQHVSRTGLLPARLEALSTKPFADNPAYQVAGEALKAGRAFPTISLWGLIEDGLASTLTRLWTEVLGDPALDLDATINRHLGELAHRLDLTLTR